MRDAQRAVWILFMSVCLGYALSACSMVQEKPLPDRIDDGYILITATSKELNEGLVLNYYPKEEVRGYADTLVGAKENLDKADELLKLGDLKSAETQIKLANAAIGGVRSWLAKQKGAKQ